MKPKLYLFYLVGIGFFMNGCCWPGDDEKEYTYGTFVGVDISFSDTTKDGKTISITDSDATIKYDLYSMLKYQDSLVSTLYSKRITLPYEEDVPSKSYYFEYKGRKDTLTISYEKYLEELIIDQCNSDKYKYIYINLKVLKNTFQNQTTKIHKKEHENSHLDLSIHY